MNQIKCCVCFVLVLALPTSVWAGVIPEEFQGRLLETASLKSPSQAFPLDPKLRPAVAFWQEVFVTYKSTSLILHDKEYMDVVWGVYKIPADDGTKAVRKRISDRTDAIIEAFQEGLKSLSRGNAPKNQWEKSLVATLGHRKKILLGAHKRVRAQRGVADHFDAGKKRAKPWLAKIKKTLKDKGLPQEIALMTFVESMFNTKARSSAGAAGVWQLMPRTARELGLKVGRRLDERMDVLKSTRAAAKLLKRNYRLLKSWPLAVTGYNHGAYGVKRAVKKVGSRDLVDLIENYDKHSWGFASKNFYAELIAMIRIFAGLGPTSAMAYPGKGQEMRHEVVS